MFFNIIFCFYFEENKKFSFNKCGWYFLFFFKNLGLIFYKKKFKIKNIKNEIHNIKIINIKILFEPHISAHALPLDGKLDFYLKNDLFIKKTTWSRHLFLFYF